MPCEPGIFSVFTLIYPVCPLQAGFILRRLCIKFLSYVIYTPGLFPCKWLVCFIRKFLQSALEYILLQCYINRTTLNNCKSYLHKVLELKTE